MSLMSIRPKRSTYYRPARWLDFVQFKNGFIMFAFIKGFFKILWKITIGVLLYVIYAITE